METVKYDKCILLCAQGGYALFTEPKSVEMLSALLHLQAVSFHAFSCVIHSVHVVVTHRCSHMSHRMIMIITTVAFESQFITFRTAVWYDHAVCSVMCHFGQNQHHSLTTVHYLCHTL